MASIGFKLRLAILSACLLSAGVVFAEGTTRIALMGDAGEAGPALTRLREAIVQEGIQSVMMPGDNLYAGTYSSVWKSWRERAFQFDAVAIGNHNGGYAAEIKFFGIPGEFYSVRKGGARFIVLNSDNESNVESQFKWFESEIANVSENLIFLMFHHPTYSLTRTHPWTEKKNFQLHMRKFLRAHGSRITALLLGHDHLTSFMSFGNVPVIVAGSGREVRNEAPVSYEEGGQRIETLFFAPKKQHWVALEILEGAQEATASVYSVQSRRSVCTARFSQGTMRLDDNCQSGK